MRGSFGCIEGGEDDCRSSCDEIAPANAADAADTSLLIAREREVWLKLDELLRRLSSVSPTAVPVPSQILGLLPPDGDWPADFALTAVAERLAANVAPGYRMLSINGASCAGVSADEAAEALNVDFESE